MRDDRGKYSAYISTSASTFAFYYPLSFIILCYPLFSFMILCYPLWSFVILYFPLWSFIFLYPVSFIILYPLLSVILYPVLYPQWQTDTRFVRLRAIIRCRCWSRSRCQCQYIQEYFLWDGQDQSLKGSLTDFAAQCEQNILNDRPLLPLALPPGLKKHVTGIYLTASIRFLPLDNFNAIMPMLEHLDILQSLTPWVAQTKKNWP